MAARYSSTARAVSKSQLSDISAYWEPYCSESSQINLCKPGSTCDSKEESDTPAQNCLFNPSCFCLMDSLAGLPPGGGGSGPTCTPNY